MAAAARRPALNGPRISVSDLIPGYAKAPLGFQPGTAWQYNPIMGFNVVARLVEDRPHSATADLRIRAFHNAPHD